MLSFCELFAVWKVVLTRNGHRSYYSLYRNTFRDRRRTGTTIFLERSVEELNERRWWIIRGNPVYTEVHLGAIKQHNVLSNVLLILIWLVVSFLDELSRWYQRPAINSFELSPSLLSHVSNLAIRLRFNI